MKKLWKIGIPIAALLVLGLVAVACDNGTTSSGGSGQNVEADAQAFANKLDTMFGGEAHAKVIMTTTTDRESGELKQTAVVQLQNYSVLSLRESTAGKRDMTIDIPENVTLELDDGAKSLTLECFDTDLPELIEGTFIVKGKGTLEMKGTQGPLRIYGEKTNVVFESDLTVKFSTTTAGSAMITADKGITRATYNPRDNTAVNIADIISATVKSTDRGDFTFDPGKLVWKPGVIIGIGTTVSTSEIPKGAGYPYGGFAFNVSDPTGPAKLIVDTPTMDISDFVIGENGDATLGASVANKTVNTLSVKKDGKFTTTTGQIWNVLDKTEKGFVVAYKGAVDLGSASKVNAEYATINGNGTVRGTFEFTNLKIGKDGKFLLSAETGNENVATVVTVKGKLENEGTIDLTKSAHARFNLAAEKSETTSINKGKIIIGASANAADGRIDAAGAASAAASAGSMGILIVKKGALENRGKVEFDYGGLVLRDNALFENKGEVDLTTGYIHFTNTGATDDAADRGGVVFRMSGNDAKLKGIKIGSDPAYSKTNSDDDPNPFTSLAINNVASWDAEGLTGAVVNSKAIAFGLDDADALFANVKAYVGKKLAKDYREMEHATANDVAKVSTVADGTIEGAGFELITSDRQTLGTPVDPFDVDGTKAEAGAYTTGADLVGKGFYILNHAEFVYNGEENDPNKVVP